MSIIQRQTNMNIQNRTVTLTLLISLTGLIHGCSVGPKYIAPELQVPNKFQTQLNNALDTQQAVLGEWWTVFNDELLNKLVDQSLKNNLDIQEALFRIQESRALRGISSSALLPTVDTSGGYSRTESSTKLATGVFSPRISNAYRLGIDASWEIDIWGRNRRTVEASQADLDATLAMCSFQ